MRLLFWVLRAGFALTCSCAFGSGLIVVAPLAFVPALRDFAAEKTATVPTELVALEEILDSTRGVDDAEKLKRYLYERWLGGKLAYVLLVGDADVLPVRYMVLDRITPAAFDYSFYPSDLYYEDLAKADGAFEDWNESQEKFHGAYFGEVRGEKNKDGAINFDHIDYLPEVAVGRWPVSTPEQARSLAQKSLAGEREHAERAITARSAALIGAKGWVDTQPHFDALQASLAGEWKLERRLFERQRKDRANEGILLDLWNGGEDLILHAGHGLPDEWDQCFSGAALGKLKNGDRLPIVFSAGCSTAYFAALAPYDGYIDAKGVKHIGTYAGEVFTTPPPPPANYQTGEYNKTGLGEQLLRLSGGGALAYIGCNTGSQPCALTLQRGFVEACSTPGVRLGDAWISGLRYYYEHEHLADLKPDSGWYPPSIFFQGMKFMVFGDPTVRVSPGPR